MNYLHRFVDRDIEAGRSQPNRPRSRRSWFQCYLGLGLVGFVTFWLVLMLRVYLHEKYWTWSYIWWTKKCDESSEVIYTTKWLNKHEKLKLFITYEKHREENKHYRIPWRIYLMLFMKKLSNYHRNQYFMRITKFKNVYELYKLWRWKYSFNHNYSNQNKIHSATKKLT